MQNKRLNIPSIALSTIVGTTRFAPGSVAESGVVGYTATSTYILIRHMRITNSATAASVVSLYKGALAGSAAGTEFAFSGVSVPGNSYIDWYGEVKLDNSSTGVCISGSANPATCTLDLDNAEIGLL